MAHFCHLAAGVARHTSAMKKETPLVTAAASIALVLGVVAVPTLLHMADAPDWLAFYVGLPACGGLALWLTQRLR